MLALAGPVWGFLGSLAAVVGGGFATLVLAVYKRHTDQPHVEREDELEGLRASVDAILPVVAALRAELTASEAKHEDCLRRLTASDGQITALSLELLRFHRLLEGKSDRPIPPEPKS